MSSLKWELRQTAIRNELDNKTIRNYKKSINAFCEYAKSEYGVNNTKQLHQKGISKTDIIQEYVYKLENDGYSHATIHTYIAPLCIGFGVNMGEIRKPKRVSTDISKCRDVEANLQGKRQRLQARYQRTVVFQECVGIRRSELANIRVRDLVKDESGNICVCVEKGKGGKYQLQRILPQDIDLVTDMFRKVRKATGSDDSKLFSASELNNKIAYHAIRADFARKSYEFYAKYDRITLKGELMARWNENHKKDQIRAINGIYKPINSTAQSYRFCQVLNDNSKYSLRGTNRIRAIEHGTPVEYDRVALLACSVFSLSHWRLDVTVTNYLV